MSYQNTIYLLPKDLLEQIQEYIDGRVVYIPKKESNKKHWGENTDTKQVLESRNNQICLDFHSGMSIQELSNKYFLTKKVFKE